MLRIDPKNKLPNFLEHFFKDENKLKQILIANDKTNSKIYFPPQAQI